MNTPTGISASPPAIKASPPAIKEVPTVRARKHTRFLTLLAAGVAALAATNYLLARRAERSNPPSGKFVTVDGLRLHYIERGTGPAIVLLHGNGAMAQDFEISGVLDLLAKNHRVIAFDRPGFGFSARTRRRIWTAQAQAALLSRALDRLDVKRVIVVGHSWGTLVALAMGLRDRPRVAGLVLLAGYYFPTARSDVVLMSWPAIPIVGDVIRYTISPVLGRLMAPGIKRKLFAPASVPARFEREFPVELSVRPSQIRASAAEAALMVPGAAALSGHYGELSMPVAILAAEGDHVIDVNRQARRMSAEIEGSTLHIIPNAGHMIHHTAPAEITGVIEAVARDSDAGALR
jgi:pimeloyl-ACP methyl ester carboxylesterase